MCLYGLFGPWPSAERRKKHRPYPDCEICCRKRVMHPAAVGVSHQREVKYKTSSRSSRAVRSKKHSGGPKTNSDHGDGVQDKVHEDDKINHEEQSNDVQETGQQNDEETNSDETKVNESSNGEPKIDGLNDHKENNDQSKAVDAAEGENGKACKSTDEACEGNVEKHQAKLRGAKKSRRKKKRR